MSTISTPSEKCPATITHNHLRGTCPVTGTSNDFCAPQPGDVRSPCPALNTLANHGYLPRNGKHISLPAFARALQAGYALSAVLAWFLSIGAFILLLQFTPLSLADIARHNYIEHDASLVHHNTALEDEYAPCAIDPALVAALMRDGKDELMNADQVAKARVRRENASPALDALHSEIGRGEMAIALRVLAAASAPDAGIPLSWLRTWMQDETFPKGWAPSRTVGLVDAFRESGKIRAAMKALVAAQSLGDTREAEAEAEPFLVEQEAESDGDDDDDEETLEEGNSLFSTLSALPREGTPPTSEEDESEHEK